MNHLHLLHQRDSKDRQSLTAVKNSVKVYKAQISVIKIWQNKLTIVSGEWLYKSWKKFLSENFRPFRTFAVCYCEIVSADDYWVQLLLLESLMSDRISSQSKQSAFIFDSSWHVLNSTVNVFVVGPLKWQRYPSWIWSLWIFLPILQSVWCGIPYSCELHAVSDYKNRSYKNHCWIFGKI